jgi:hypothetical protein
VIWKAYVVPSIICPKASVDSNRPVTGVLLGAIDPERSLLPFFRRISFKIPASDGYDNACNGNSSQCEELEKNKYIGAACADFGGDTVESSDQYDSSYGDSLVDPDTCIHGVCADKGSDSIFAKDDGNNSSGTRLQYHDSAPGEEETCPFAIDFAQVNLRAAIERHSTTELGIARSTGPGKQTSDDPYYQGSDRGAGIYVDLSGRRKDAGANDEANN